MEYLPIGTRVETVSHGFGVIKEMEFYRRLPHCPYRYGIELEKEGQFLFSSLPYFFSNKIVGHPEITPEATEAYHQQVLKDPSICVNGKDYL